MPSAGASSTSPADDSGSGRGSKVKAVVGLVLAGVAIVVAIIFAGGSGSAGVRDPRAAIPPMSESSTVSSAVRPLDANGQAVPVNSVTPPAPVADALAAATAGTGDQKQTTAAAAAAGGDGSTSTGNLLKDQLNTLAGAKLPTNEVDAKNLMTPAGAFYGNIVESRIGGLIDGCTPTTGPELHYLVENTTCPVITLLPGGNYTLRNFIRVPPGRRVSVIGRPLNMPTIDAHRAYRSFTVEPGGFLDLRFVRLFRGKPIRIIRRYYYEIRGGGVYVRAGGTAVITGCLFTVNPVLITEFLLTSSPETTVRMLGGYLLQEAGTLTVYVYTVGGHVLILGGTALFTGCTFTSSLLFVNVVGVGDSIAVFGGNAIFTGCAWTFNCALVAGYGVGFMIFVGGGCTILTGCSGSNNMGANAFFGSGNGLFSGGGVTIITGMSFNTDVALFAGAGVGAVVSLGGGVLVKTGVSQTCWTACQFVAFLGIAVFVGSGTVVESECHWARVGSQTAFYGGGGSLYLGSGVATIVNADGFVANIVANIAAGGGHMAVLAGWLTMVNTYFYKFEVITAHYGQGFDVLVLAGGAVFVNSGYGGRAYALFHGNPGLVNIWVAGNVVTLNKTYHGAVATHKGVNYFRARHMHLNYKYTKTKNRALGEGFEPRYLESVADTVNTVMGTFDESAVNTLAGSVQLPASATAQDSAADAIAATTSEATTVAAGAVTQAATGAVAMQKLPWPGMDVSIPAVPTTRKTDNIFIAGDLDDCSLCDVRPGTTGENIDGPGSGTCTMAEDCQKMDEEDEDDDENVIMWNPPSGGGPANTSVAILQVTATYTPKDAASKLDPKAIMAAVQGASEELDLPQRYLIRVATGLPNPLMLDDEDYITSVLADGSSLQEKGATLSEEDLPLEDRPMYEACSQTKSFKVYLVSDWRNVTRANMQGLRSDDAADAMTAAVQESQGDNVAEICNVQVTSAGALFVPSLVKKVSVLGEDGSLSSLGAGLFGGATNLFGQQPFQDGDGEAGLAAAAAAQLMDAATDKRVDEVVPGESYTLELSHFKPNKALTVKLVPANGVAATTVGALVSKPDANAAGAEQQWRWTVGKDIKPGAYYLEVSAPETAGTLLSAATAADNRFAFTQAFDVVGGRRRRW